MRHNPVFPDWVSTQRSLWKRQYQGTSIDETDNDLRFLVLVPLLFIPRIIENQQAIRGLPRCNYLVTKEGLHMQSGQVWKPEKQPIDVLWQRVWAFSGFLAHPHIGNHVEQRERFPADVRNSRLHQQYGFILLGNRTGRHAWVLVWTARVHLDWINYQPQNGARGIRLSFSEMREQEPCNHKSNDHDNCRNK